MKKNVRVRFAPSPTGGLHLGGVRTVLFNYLFARQNGGKFIVRIEDTDRSRFVPGAEEYIFNCLKWCGLTPDESPLHGGGQGPYRQSERKALYKEYAEKLVSAGQAYYAFDSTEELEKMREQLKEDGSSSLQYDHRIRMRMNNSLRLSAEETQKLLEAGTPHVIRIKIDPDKTIRLHDMIRGELTFDAASVDDKVLMKADGMPTYHLAVVVDDHLMNITHAFRGEEWLPSAPVHVLLWEYLFGIENMPHWAHLPLILKPDGHGKLSKRDGERLGFPVYAMNWTDPATQHSSSGFRELGFLPEAFVNFLALLGWNDGTEQEIYSMEQLIEAFSIERIHKGGAKFDFEKAKWFNHEWIKRSETKRLLSDVQAVFTSHGIHADDPQLLSDIINLIKDRCTLLTDFYHQGAYFYTAPEVFDEASVMAKWDAGKSAFFTDICQRLMETDGWDAQKMEALMKETASGMNIKIGEIQMILRIMLVGNKMGPAVFAIAALLGRDETIRRIRKAARVFDGKS